MCVDLKSAKIDCQVISHFALLGSTRVKTLCKHVDEIDPRLVVMMLSMIGSLIWIAVWIYFGVHVATLDDENGPIASLIFFIPACIVLVIVGKSYFVSVIDNAKHKKQSLIRPLLVNIIVKLDQGSISLMFYVQLLRTQIPKV